MKLFIATLFYALVLGWITGCGPKPPPRTVAPAPPEVQVSTVETDRKKQPPVIDFEPVPASPPPIDAEIPVDFVIPDLIHKIRWRHETLYAIAQWYTGKGINWRRLAAENPQIAPHLIRIGDTIRIPDALLTTRRPMPGNFLKPLPKFKSKPKPVPLDPPTTPKTIQTPPLYGPVGEDTPPALPDEDDALPVPLETID